MTPEQIEEWLRQFDKLPNRSGIPSPMPARSSAKPRAVLSDSDTAKMRHMRKEGFTVGDIARAFGCAWETARRRTLGFDK